MTWIATIPVWGDWYIDRFINHGLPSLKVAVTEFGKSVTFRVYTDQADRLRPLFDGFSVEFRDLPMHIEKVHPRFAACHQNAAYKAKSGDRLMLLCADMVVSRELFSACDARFEAGKKAVVCCATRTVGSPPIGAKARELLRWTMKNAHPITKDLFWGTGKSACPWTVYFGSDEGITLRGFHLHPIAIVKDRTYSFEGTIDQDLLNALSHEEIHVVTSADELGIAEVTVGHRDDLGRHQHPMTLDSIANWASGRAAPIHRWLSSHSIIITGVGAKMSDVIWPQIMERVR